MTEEEKIHEGYRGEVTDEKVAEAFSVLMRYCADQKTTVVTETIEVISDENPGAEPLTIEVLFAMAKKTDEEESEDE